MGLLYIRTPIIWYYRFFPGKILVTRQIFFIFYPSPNVAPKPTDQSCSNSILSVHLEIYPARFFFFDLPLKLRVIYLRNKQTNSVTNMEFYKYVQYCFCCYVIKSAIETDNKVFLSVIWNPLLLEINLSRISTLDIKREQVCAVCPYLLILLTCLNHTL